MSIKIAEIFHSIQGEGLYVGQPSVFIRTFGCNLKCASFGMPGGGHSVEADQIAVEYKNNPDWDYKDLPLTKTGCDSYASWHKGFKDLSPMLTIDQIMYEVEQARCVNEDAGAPKARKNSHVVITGGEPLLGWQKQYPELLDRLADEGYKDITFETNGTQEICDELHDYFMLNHISGKGINFTFSVSPKIASSGEPTSKTLRPVVVAKYQAYGTVYLKFVVAKGYELTNVKYFVREYNKVGWEGEVYLMPCGGDPEMYNMNAAEVASFAMILGCRYSPRLQVDLYKNAHGT